ncbi:MAG TPA: GYD domain-containing protein [Stellaceae bacterium]|nr:GYD domain-containing protein [Stellaceae bacterium]
MAKYLFHASYSPEGLKGLQKDKASGRLAAVRQIAESVGGKLECMYYALGEDDVVIIADLPDNVAASAISLTVSAAGLVRTRTTALMTIEETDKALAMNVGYRKPGG